ncbi:MAG: cation diffusion facilitator family transporter [Planctomycetota bacterium]
MSLRPGADSSVKPVLIAVLANALITVAKSAGWAFTMSPSLLAEAIHSFADTANQALLYVGIRHGRGGATREFPWGKARARYLWNLVSATGIFFVGFGVTTYHGFTALLAGHHEVAAGGGAGLVAIGILVFAFLLEGYSFWVALGVVRRDLGSLSMLEYLRHGDNPTNVGVLLEDAIAVLGVVVALLARTVRGAILIGILLGIMALVLAAANSRLLIGAALSATEEGEIHAFIESRPSVEKVVNLKTDVLGPDRVRLVLEVEFHGAIMIDRANIERNAARLRAGEEEPLPVLVATAERMVRRVGGEINRLEAAIHERFPDIAVIALEVN